MFDESDDQKPGGYWPSVSDLFMTLFIISLVLIGTLYYVLIPKNRPADDRLVVEAVGADLKNIRNPVNLMRKVLGKEELRASQAPREVVDGLRITSEDVVEELSTLREKVSGLEHKIGDLISDNQKLTNELNDKPPIIRIDEAKKEYRFASGSAVMGADFLGGLNKGEFITLAAEILKRNRSGKVGVDTLEIVGHTDGQAVRASGNLDDQLPEFLAGRERDLGRLNPGSNNDLGLLRSLAVKRAWEDFVEHHPQKEELRRVAVRSYSAGQTIPPDETDTDNPETYRRAEERSRRIEIRLTKLGDR